MVSCASNKQVYWCGDHPCANNNEKKKYFKEKMIVEVKIIEKKNTKNMSSIEKILQQGQLNNKNIQEKSTKPKDINIKATREEKRLAKKIYKEEKRAAKEALKEEKKLAKKARKDEKALTKAKFKKINKSNKNITLSNNDSNKLKNSSQNFNDYVNKILVKNKSKPYPDINKMQR